MDAQHDMSDAEIEGLKKLLELNATQARQHFTDLAATWGVGGLSQQLDGLLEGLQEQDRPEVAERLAAALKTYLAEFGPEGVVGTADTYRDHA